MFFGFIVGVLSVITYFMYQIKQDTKKRREIVRDYAKRAKSVYKAPPAPVIRMRGKGKFRVIDGGKK